MTFGAYDFIEIISSIDFLLLNWTKNFNIQLIEKNETAQNSTLV